jgi:hypothetical protein
VTNRVTVGADPEVFVKDSSNTIVTAIGKVGGTKQYPRKVKAGALQEDNVLAEFNINPATRKVAFIKNINTVVRQLEEALKGHNLFIDIRASHSYKMEELTEPQAMVFGCEPDFSAWANGAINPKPECDDKGLRTAGGHVHLGWDKPTDAQRHTVIKWMDVLVGVPSVLLDKDTLRRKLYGKAGAFRPKKYGAEYRSVSNFWLANDDLMGWIWDQSQLAVENKDNNIVSEDSELIQRAINFNDVEAARHILNMYQVELPKAA